MKRWLVFGVGLVALAAVVAGAAPMYRAAAKEPTTNIWLVGGDLPHPVRIPNEELENPGSTIGESFTGGSGEPAGDLGSGYDIVSGGDLAAALNSRMLDGGFETCYPRGADAHAVEYWTTASGVYSAVPSDRQVRNSNLASGGRFEIYPRYIALARAGLIPEQPTFSEAIAASAKLFGAHALVGGQATTPADASALASAVATPARTDATIPLGALKGPFYPVELWFGNSSTGLQFLYAPPGALGKSGLLFPQSGPQPHVDQPGVRSATATRTTAKLDRLLKHDGAIVQRKVSSSRPDRWLIASLSLAGAVCLALAAATLAWRRTHLPPAGGAPHAA